MTEIVVYAKQGCEREMSICNAPDHTPPLAIPYMYTSISLF